MSNEIMDKLNQAVNDDDATAAGSVKEALDKPAGSETKASAEQTTKPGQKAQEKSQSVPYDRFKEKVDALEKATAKLDVLTERDKELSVKLVQLESANDVIERLRGLAQDDRYKPLVETLDRALKGIHEEVETGDKTEKQGEVATKRLLDDHKVQLEDALAQARADMLWQQVQTVSEQMLDALGDEYDVQDKEAIAKLWTPATDWDSIEENPDSLRQELLASLKNVVETYGEPRGALKLKISQFEQKAQQGAETTTLAVKPEDELKGILDKDWGKVKTTAEGKVIGAEHSDEDFRNALARVMKMGRR